MRAGTLKNKSYAFALRIVRLHQYLTTKKREYKLSDQVIRSGTAVGALIREAEFAQSRAKYNWDLVLFSDEKTFQIGGGKKKQWQNPKKRVKREVETHPKQVHVWAGIGAYFKLLWLFLSTT